MYNQRVMKIIKKETLLREISKFLIRIVLK